MTNATREEVLLSLLCCHADLCRMEGQTKDREHDIVASVARAVSRAILNLVEPEEERREEKHPGVIVDPKGENPPRCLRCGRDAEVVHYMGEEWVLCPKCGCAYRIKRGKDEK